MYPHVKLILNVISIPWVLQICRQNPVALPGLNNRRRSYKPTQLSADLQIANKRLR